MDADAANLQAMRDQYLPEAWDVTPIATADAPLFLDFLLPSKAPMGEQFNEIIPKEMRFTPQKLALLQSSAGRRIHLVIDLTKSTRYYDPAALENMGVQYEKIPCEGHEGPPDAYAVYLFYMRVMRASAEMRADEEAREDLKKMPHKKPQTIKWQEYKRAERAGQAPPGPRPMKPIVVVHCTHGFNRTGAMLVHYAMRSSRWPDLLHFLQSFASCRPPGIYKQNYVDELAAYYHEKLPPAFKVTQPPWRSGIGGGVLPDAKVPPDDLFSPARDPVYKATTASNPVPIPNEGLRPGQAPAAGGGAGAGPGAAVPKHDDLIGEDVGEELARAVFQIASNMCLSRNIADESPDTFQFSGSQPVSLMSDNMNLLREKEYMVTWKADGTRYLLLLRRDGVFAMDRKPSVRRLQMRFPLRLPPSMLQSAQTAAGTPDVHHDTLLDGELVVDKDPGTGAHRLRFLAYDIVALQGQQVGSKPFSERYEMINEYVEKPKRMFMERCRGSYDVAKEPFSFRRKLFWDISDTRKVLDEVIPKQITHETDGLIFQPKRDAYVPRTDTHLLKWKFPWLNSVDFYISFDNNIKGELFVGGDNDALKPVEGAELEIPLELEDEMSDNCIGECVFLGPPQKWRLLRVRRDKTTPNFWKTFELVFKSIQDNITKEAVCQVVEESKRSAAGAT